MVILIRCNDIVSDPRAMKYVRFYQEKGIDYKLIGWDRDGLKPDIPNAFLWDRKAGFNVGGLTAVNNRIGWMWFVYKSLKELTPNNSTLHGCDLDSVFPASVYKFFHPINKVIFDIFDWFSATLYKQNGLIRFAFKVMERFSVKHSDYVFICERERIEQIPFYVNPKKIKVLPNIPYFDHSDFLRIDEFKQFSNNLLTVSYVGGFTEDRFLKELVRVAKEGLFNLLIAGFGNLDIESELNDACGKYDNIRYYGKVKYDDGLNVSNNSDVIFAMYCKTNPNHLFAAPNKYYEAMFLGKPIITTKGTIVEKKVVGNDIGWAIEEDVDELRNLIRSLDKNEIKKKGMNAQTLWNSTYKNYVSEFMDNSYSSILK